MFLALLLKVVSFASLASIAHLESLPPTCVAWPDPYCKLDACALRLTKLETLIGTHVEFSATGAVKNGDAIIFPKVIINNGNGYDNNTGKFTAPVSGFYYFGATLSPGQEKEWQMIECFILKNGAKVLRLFTDKNGADKVGSYPATVTAPMYLNASDVVNVGSCLDSNGIHDDLSSTINGFYLHP